MPLCHIFYYEIVTYIKMQWSEKYACNEKIIFRRTAPAYPQLKSWNFSVIYDRRIK
jgi:hypothetical protein